METERRQTFLDAVRTAVREEVRAAGASCQCRLEREDRRDFGQLLHLCREVGVDALRDNHQFVSEVRQGVRHVRLTALTAAVGSVLTVLGAGLVMLFKTKAGN